MLLLESAVGLLGLVLSVLEKVEILEEVRCGRCECTVDGHAGLLVRLDLLIVVNEGTRLSGK